MILDVKRPQLLPPRRTNWKDEFRSRIYQLNKRCIIDFKNDPQKKTVKAAREEAGKKILNCLSTHQKVYIKDSTHTEGCHAYYSSYIPLKMQAKFDDELDCTFPYLKNLTERGRINDKQLAIIEISQHMKLCKQTRNLASGWKQCLEKYLCGLDAVRAIEIFLQIKKRGTGALKELHSKYGENCLQTVFFQRVMMAGKYFRVGAEQKNMMLLSMENTEQINQVTMPKTMKTLFCNVCLIYDCGQHSLDQTIKEKQYQYLAPRNVLTEEERLKSALGVCMAYRELQAQGKLQGKDLCSSKCFKTLTLEGWRGLQKIRAALASPLIKGLIKLGIQMHGYSPCSIWNLLINVTPQKNQSILTCSLVFLFFIQEHNIFSRLEKKLANDQTDMLKRERQGERSLSEPPRKNRKKIKIAHHEHLESLSMCCHYFVGERPSDEMCDSCCCRERGFCFPQCLCSPACPIRKRGCNCRKEDCRTKRCPCFNEKRQCEPNVCNNCFGDRGKCNNSMILQKKFKKTRVGRSSVQGAGLGLFAGEEILKDELVMIYAGELIETSIDLLRQTLSVDLSFYNFGSPEGTIDARFMGNLSRFINHGNTGEDNLRSQNILSEGRYKIGFYAMRNIQTGEQLFFNYDGEGQLFKHYRDKYPFIKSNKKVVKS